MVEEPCVYLVELRTSTAFVCLFGLDPDGRLQKSYLALLLQVWLLLICNTLRIKGDMLIAYWLMLIGEMDL